MNGPRFMVGEEVLYHGRRYVIAAIRAGAYGYRLLSASERHTQEADIVWANESGLAPLDAYTRARDDTGVA